MITETQHTKTEKHIVPQLRFAEFEGEWKETTLGLISSQASYGIGAAATIFDGTNQYLRITDIDEESRSFKPNPLTSPEGKIDEKYKLKEGDIVFARTGASVGKSYLYNPSDGNLIYAGFLIKFNISKANPKFVYALTFKESYNKWVQVYSMRSGQPGLNAEEYKALKLNLPTLPEQQKIASFLTAVDTKLQQLNQKKELLEQYKKGVMQQLFSRQLRFKQPDGSDYPDWGKLSSPIKIISGNAYSLKEYKDSGVKLVQGLNIMPGKLDIESPYYIDKNNNSKHVEIHNGDILLALNRPVTSNKLKVCKYQSNNVAYLYQRAGKLSFDERVINSNFLYQYLTSEVFLRKLLIELVGSDQPYIKSNLFEIIKIKIPVISEQQQIASYLAALDTKIETVAQQIETTQQFKKGLLQQMFV